MAALDELLAAREMVVVCGSGGVGKTTTAAALGAMAATQLGGKVLVLTVDPARRLAGALGLESFGNTETRIDLSGGGRSPRGELWAAMLDTKAGWDDLIRRHAPDATVRDGLLTNPLYENITARFVNSHDYIAMERLHEVHASGRYDLVIVDTPPSRNALDLLDAPGRMTDFFASKLLRWITVPYRSRLFTMASKPFYQVADRVLGARFLQDIGALFTLFQKMEPGFVARSREVEGLLTDPRTTFVVVSTPEAAPVHEARFFVDELRRRRLDLGAVVLNRTLPASMRDRAAAKSATALAAAVRDDRPWLRKVSRAAGGDIATTESVLATAAGSFQDVVVVAKREAERRAELAKLAPVVTAPALETDIHDLDGLFALGAHLWR